MLPNPNAGNMNFLLRGGAMGEANQRLIDSARATQQAKAGGILPGAGPGPQPTYTNTTANPAAARAAYANATPNPTVAGGYKPPPKPMTVTGKIAQKMGPWGAAAAGVIDEAGSVSDTLRNPNTTGYDKAAGVAESAARVGAGTVGGWGGAVAGGKTGLALGAMTGPAAPIAAPVLGMLGALGGGYLGYKGARAGADMVIDAARPAAGVESSAGPVATQPPTLRDDAFTRGQETLARTGVTQDPSIGGGRSRMLNTETYKAPDAPGPSAYDRRADLRNAIENNVFSDSLKDGRIWTDGKSYAGVNVKEGASFANAADSMSRPGRGTVSTLDMSAAREYNNKMAAQYDARMAAQNSGGGGGGLRQPMSVEDGVRAQVKAFKDAGYKISAPTLRSIINGQNERYKAEIQGDVTLRTNAETNAARSRDNNATNAATNERERLKAEREGFYKDREFNLNLSKAQIENRRKGEENVINRMTSLVPVTGDAAKDGAAKTQMMRDLNQLFGQEQKRLKEQVKANPKDKQSAQQLAYLEENGLAAFEGREQEIWEAMAGIRVRRQMNENPGFWMGQGQQGTSTKPLAPGEAQYQRSALDFLPGPLKHQGYIVTPGGAELPIANVAPDDREALLRPNR